MAAIGRAVFGLFGHSEMGGKNFILGLTLIGMLPVPFAAQPVLAAPVQAPAKPSAAHYQLYDVMFAGFNLDQLAHNATVSVVAGIFRNDTELAGLQKRRPQLSLRMAAAIEPYFAVWMGRLKKQRRDEVTQILAKHLTAAEAMRMANFYATPVGQKVLRAAGNHLSYDDTVDATLNPGGRSDSEALRSDADRSVRQAMPEVMADLSNPESAQLIAMGKDPALPKLKVAADEFMRLPDPPLESFSTPEEVTQLRAAIQKVIAEESTAS